MPEASYFIRYGDGKVPVGPAPINFRYWLEKPV